MNLQSTHFRLLALLALTFVLGVATTAIYFALRSLKPADPTLYWTQVGSVGTCAGSFVATVGVLVAAWSFRSQVQQNKLSLGANMMLKLVETFENRSLRETRARAAAKLAKIQTEDDGDIDSILDFFEQVALLERRGAINTEFVWHAFYHWLFHYYHLTIAYRASRREADPSVWADLESLYKRIMDLQDRARRDAIVRPTPTELAKFREEEMHLNARAE